MTTETRSLSLKELHIDHLRDLYNAEDQIIKALPTIIERATAPKLKKCLGDHLQETFKQLDRLKQIFQDLGESPHGQTCVGMKGVLEEGSEALAEKMDSPELMDAALIDACRKMEHYEISAYETAIAFAEWLNESAAVRLLNTTLEEEQTAEAKLTQLRSSEVMQRPETLDTPLIKRNSLKKQITINDSPGG